MHPISVMIKPASSACNLQCKYCFYADEAAKRATPYYGKMTTETLENCVALCMNAAKGTCNFAFQGGEPTLAGLEFFRTVVALQKKYAKKGLVVTNALQTNGLLLDEEWCSFLKENHFLVGLSLDGTKDTHDLYRCSSDGKGSYSTVLRIAQRLKTNHVEFNILTVVTSQLSRNITKVYNFYKRNEWLYQQYIPCMDSLGEDRGEQGYSLKPEEYGVFLKKLFDLWYQDLTRGFYVSIRYFDNLLRIMHGIPPESCAMCGHCNIQYLVEGDGTVFPCDFYALDSYRLGNVNTNTIEEMDARRKEIRFIEDSYLLTEGCKECPWVKLCKGGCRRDYINGQIPKNYYCESFRSFFEYAYPKLENACQLYQKVAYQQK